MKRSNWVMFFTFFSGWVGAMLAYSGFPVIGLPTSLIAYFSLLWKSENPK